MGLVVLDNFLSRKNKTMNSLIYSRVSSDCIGLILLAPGVISTAVVSPPELSVPTWFENMPAFQATAAAAPKTNKTAITIPATAPPLSGWDVDGPPELELKVVVAGFRVGVDGNWVG